MLRVYAALAVALAGFAGLVGSYWLGRTDGVALCQGAESLAREISAEAVAAAASSTAQAISLIEVKNVTIRQRLETEVREREVYRDCVADPAARRLLNDTLRGGSVGSVAPGGGELPRPDGP